jgi:hypothetical protein
MNVDILPPSCMPDCELYPEICSDFVLLEIKTQYDITMPEKYGFTLNFNHTLLKFPMLIKEDLGISFILKDGT